MALKKTSETNFGFNIPNTYHRVENIKLNKNSINFQVLGYADVQKNAFEYKNYACAYDLNGVNPIKQAYEYIKTLPEFAGAIDC
jgi:hypothetical protein